jgi:hypothetical protein
MVILLSRIARLFALVCTGLTLSLACLSALLAIEHWGWWGLSQPVIAYVLWGMYKDVRKPGRSQGWLQYSRIAASGAVLGLALGATISSIQSLAFESSWQWTAGRHSLHPGGAISAPALASRTVLEKLQHDRQMADLQKEGSELFILKHVLEHGPDFALKGASFAAFFLFVLNRTRAWRKSAESPLLIRQVTVR